MVARESPLLRSCSTAFSSLGLMLLVAVVLWTRVDAQQRPNATCTRMDTPTQLKALQQFYRETNGQTWLNSSQWLSTTSCRAPPAVNQTLGVVLPSFCCWLGVLCCEATVYSAGLQPLQVCPNIGSVSAIILPYNNLTGDFPNAAVGMLGCALQRLSLHHNALTGSLSDELSTLVRLATLQLDYNNLQGSLPAAMAQMVSLQALSMAHNNLSGVASPCGTNSSLLDVSLAYNSIGTLDVWNCSNLVSFDITSNSLQLGRLRVNTSPSMHIVRASHAGLKFTLPDVLLDFFPLLTILELADNKLYGSLPVGFSNANALVTLDLSTNSDLKGTLPPQYSKLDSLAMLDLSGTNLTGTIPDEWGIFFDASRITRISLRANSRLSCCSTWVVDANTGVGGLVYNQSKPRLPSFLKFTTTLVPVVTQDGRYIRHTWCPSVVPANTPADVTDVQRTATFELDPHYYMYEGCSCETGYTATYIKEDPLRLYLTCDPMKNPTEAGSGLLGWQIALIIVLPVVAIVVLAIVFVTIVMRRARATHHVSWFGKVLPPDAVKGTTIVITDMEDSTLLWETLPTRVMNEALLLHDSTVRRVAQKHQGYESATAGDSFVLSFHDAMSAVRFAAECQSELLQCAWPPELLAMASAVPTYMYPVAQTVAGTMATPKRKLDGAYTSTFHPLSVSWRGSREPSGGTREPSGGTQSGSVTLQCEDTIVTWNESTDAPQDPEVDMAESAEAIYATVRAYLVGVWQPVARDMPSASAGGVRRTTSDNPDKAVLVNCGLRVRIGMSTCTGLDLEVVTNRTSGRLEYGGACTTAAAAVETAATGGMNLLSETTFFQLNGDELLLHEVLVAHMGEHVLQADEEAQNLYCAMLRGLLPRCTLLAPVRSVQLVSASFLDAPFSHVTICFMNVAGIASLSAWNQELAQQCLGVYEQCLHDELQKYGGYLVETNNGLFLASFVDTATADALRWALSAMKACLNAAWPQELLQHELGEVVAVTRFLDNVAPMPMRSAPSAADMLNSVKILFRGLRIKCGLDTGEVVADVHAVQGRVTYRGRVMNRAARISSAAKSGQVWCSVATWIKSGHDVCHPMSAVATLSGAVSQQGIRGIPLGSFDLKGIGEMEIVHCVTEDGREMLVNGEDGVVICSYSNSFNANKN